MSGTLRAIQEGVDDGNPVYSSMTPSEARTLHVVHRTFDYAGECEEEVALFPKKSVRILVRYQGPEDLQSLTPPPLLLLPVLLFLSVYHVLGIGIRVYERW